MTDARTYPAGVPCWIDTEQPDPHAAVEFYGSLLGWTFEDAVPAAPGTYWIAKLDGVDAAGMSSASADVARWNTYVAVDDTEVTVDLVRHGGGGTVREPADAGPAGRSAAFVDPAGAEFGVWKPGRRLGAQVVNVPGAWNFSDLHTTDLAGAREFYGSVFGWEADDLDVGGPATMWRRPGYADHLAATIDPDIHARQAAVGAPPGFADAIAWLAPLQHDEVPHWHVTFAIADRDDSVATALRLGATVVSGPTDTPWTKTAVVRDPQGASFTLSQFAPPGS